MTRLFKTKFTLLPDFLLFGKKKSYCVYTIDKEGMHSETGGKHTIRECRGSLGLLGSNQGHIAFHLTNLAMSSIIA